MTQPMIGLASIYNALAPSWCPRVLDWEHGFRPLAMLDPVGSVSQEPIESRLFWCSVDARFYIYVRLDDAQRWYRSVSLTGEALQRLQSRLEHVADPAK